MIFTEITKTFQQAQIFSIRTTSIAWTGDAVQRQNAAAADKLELSASIF